MTDYSADAELARAIAERAGALLLSLRRAELAGCGARGDAQANALILARLAEARPDDAILSEEAADDRARCAARRVWIVDPLDGTREYAEDRDDWAVHVGLAVDGIAVAGAVALPAQDRVFDSLRANVDAPPSRCPRIAVSRTRAPALAAAVAAAVDGVLVPMGSAGAKAMAVLTGEVDAYLHLGGQHEWDSCAPVAVALGAGLHASRADGGPLRYNGRDTSIPDLLICRPEHSAALLAAIAAHR